MRLKTLFLKHQGWIIPKWIISWMSSLLIDSWMLSLLTDSWMSSRLKDSSTVKELKVIHKMGEREESISLKGIGDALPPPPPPPTHTSDMAEFAGTVLAEI